MIFGKIDYLNLLPFHHFMARYLRRDAEKRAWRLKGGVPSKVNRDFEAGRVDAAMISSVKSRRRRCVDLGIVADGEVMSVLLLPGPSRPDGASETSNALAAVLGLRGEVQIGDRALTRYFQEGVEGAVDLAAAWKARFGLPFVFARLCAGPRAYERVRRIERLFLKKPVRVPYRVRRREALRHGLTVAQLDSYLDRIGYRIGWREKRSLKLFFFHVRRHKALI